MRRSVVLACLLAACGGEPAASPPPPRALPHSVRLALGTSFGCALTRAQDVVCWGEIPAEVAGIGAADRIRVPHAIATLHGAIEIAASELTLCARMPDHRVLCWGEDALTVPVRERIPAGVRGLERTRSLAVGEHLVCGIEGEALRCVGRNRRVSGTVAPAAVLLSVGGSVCAVDGSGPARCVDPDDDAPHDVPGSEGAITIAIADGVCAVTAAGELLCDPDATTPADAHLEPVAGAPPAAWVSGAANVRCVATRGEGGAASGVTCTRSAAGLGPVESALHEGVVALAVGGARPWVSRAWHACAIVEDDDVRCWGVNRVGELGVPVPSGPVVPMDELPRARAVAVGDADLWMIDEAGTVVSRPLCCAEPAVVAGVGPATHLVALGEGACAREESGDVVCWHGDARVRFEALGRGPLIAVGGVAVCAQDGERILCARPDRDVRLALVVGPVRDVAGYGDRLCAIQGEVADHGDVACMSILGSGSRRGSQPFRWNRFPSLRIDASGGSRPLDIARFFAGEEQMFAVRSDGTALALGHNGAGQLGLPPSRPLSEAARARLPQGTTEMAFTYHASCAWGPGTELWCAGLDDALAPRDVPRWSWGIPSFSGRSVTEEELRGDGSWTPIPDVRDVRSVSLGRTLGCAVDGAGALRCFGRWPPGAERARVAEPVRVPLLRGIGDAVASPRPALPSIASPPRPSSDEAPSDDAASLPTPPDAVADERGAASSDGWTTRGGQPIEIEPGDQPIWRGGARSGSRGSVRVRFATPEVRGALSRSVVQRRVREHLGDVRSCYEQGLVVDPTIAGSVEVVFIVAPAGTVQTAAITHDEVHSARLDECLRIAVRRWTFPEPPGGGVVGVSVPFVLEIAGE